MKVLVLGAGGMMGHMACRVLGDRHEVVGTIRSSWSAAAPLARFLDRSSCLDHIDVLADDDLRSAFDITTPDAVLNCVGIVKQLAAANDAVASIECNSLLPHRLAQFCNERGARLVHLSTDCVFSGRSGAYREDDLPDPVDLYGRSKLLGETSPEEGLTIRTSIVGRQLTGATSLFEWVIGNRGGRIKGFDRAIYTGLTTAALARVIERVMTDFPDLSGVWQVASRPITKYELLLELNEVLDLGIDVEKDIAFHCDRSLDGTRFAARTGIEVPSWEHMLREFAEDQASYAGIGECEP